MRTNGSHIFLGKSSVLYNSFTRIIICEIAVLKSRFAVSLVTFLIVLCNVLWISSEGSTSVISRSVKRQILSRNR